MSKNSDQALVYTELLFTEGLSLAAIQKATGLDKGRAERAVTRLVRMGKAKKISRGTRRWVKLD